MKPVVIGYNATPEGVNVNLVLTRCTTASYLAEFSQVLLMRGIGKARFYVQLLFLLKCTYLGSQSAFQLGMLFNWVVGMPNINFLFFHCCFIYGVTNLNLFFQI